MPGDSHDLDGLGDIGNAAARETKFKRLIAIWDLTGALPPVAVRHAILHAEDETLAVFLDPPATGPEHPIADSADSVATTRPPCPDLPLVSKGYLGILDPDTSPAGLTLGGAGAGESTMRAAFQVNQEREVSAQYGGQCTVAELRGAVAVASAIGERDLAESCRRRLWLASSYALVETLNVTGSKRYARGHQGHDETYCNIYAFDYVTQMGGYIPRLWWTDAAMKKIEEGKSVAAVYGGTVHEVGATHMNLWLRRWGEAFGWHETDADGAQTAANTGRLALVSADSHSIGHVTVVLPESLARQAVRDQGSGKVTIPLQSQAGSNNVKYGCQDKGLWWNRFGHINGGFFYLEGRMDSVISSPAMLGMKS